MGKHESIKDEPSGAAEALSALAKDMSAQDLSAKDMSATPRMAMASIDPPDIDKAIETIKIETEKLASAVRADEPALGRVSPARSQHQPAKTGVSALTSSDALCAHTIAVTESPRIELASTEIPKIESPRIAPDLAPEIDAGGPGADDAATADDVPEPPAETAPPRISRFTMLAAALALAAALGGMLGAVGAASFMHGGPAPIAVAGRTGLEEFQALKENVVQARVELAAMKVSIESGHRNASAQFTRIGERVERVERLQAEPVAKLNKAIETLDRLVRADARDVTGSVAGSPTTTGGPSSRPGALEGWVVRDVQRGTALIEGRMGLIEVDQGDVVPGLGRIDAIRRQDGRWVVVTSKGTIMPPR